MGDGVGWWWWVKEGAAVASDTRTGSDHGDGRLDVDPLVCVDTGVDEDEAVKVAFLDTAKSVFDGVVVLRGNQNRAVSVVGSILGGGGDFSECG